MSDSRYDVAVIGEGISGLTAAGQVASLGARAATFEANLFGGLVLNVASLHGFGGGASGADVAAALAESNAAAGVESIASGVAAITPLADGFILETSSGRYHARRVVIATGARPRSLNLPEEERLAYHGVSHCADCDGPLFAGQPVAVVGGGDAAFMQAARLAEMAGEVHLLVRGRTPRARAEFVDGVAAAPNVCVVTNARVTALLGAEALEAVELDVNGTTRRLEVPGVFIYVGGQPASELASKLATTDGAGGIVANEEGVTSFPGLYAIGAVRAGYGGRLAAAEAEARRCAAHAVASLGG